MKKRWIAALLVSAMAVTSLTGCSGGDAASSDNPAEANAAVSVPTEPFGDQIKYDPSIVINDGKDVSIELWEWGSDDLFQKLIDGYTGIHPNVSVKLVNNPWDDYWTKLPLSLGGANGPALFNVHNSYHENLINYMAPYDISTADLEADFNSVSAHVIDEKIYYIDYGIMTGSVYYNKDMWNTAGLTDGDIPKTWEQMRQVAKKLTIRDGENLVQAGLNFNGDFHQNYLLGLNYQSGQNLFDTDGKTALINTDAMKASMLLLVDLYEKDGVGSKDFGAKGADSFGQGQSAMVIQWGHFYNTMNTNFPDINFGVFEIPAFEENPYAYNRYNGESSFGINKNAPADQQAVAQDMVKYFLANNEIQKEFNIAMSTFPAKKSLAADQDILANPSMAVLADHIDRYIWPGPMPATMETSLKTAGENIFFNGMSIDAALAEAEAAIRNDMKTSNFQSVESLYKYAE